MQKNLYAFTLGREYKLSLAELGHVFGFNNLKTFHENVAIFELPETLNPDIISRLGGTIRIITVLAETDEKKFATDVITRIINSGKDGKVSFALGAYGTEFRLSDIGLRIKKTLQESQISARLVNTKNENINAATFKKERLSKSKHEYNLIKMHEYSLLGYTIACQDIDAYARRDTGKSRDMIVGMMPPKLVQIMLNIALSKRVGDISDIAIYDPFCGLGTTLIEAANTGITHLYGSDIAPEMVQATESSLTEFIKEEKVWQERIKTAGGTPKRDFSNIEFDIWQMDAREIGKPTPLKGEGGSEVCIISEGYLGEIMSPRDISLDRVKSERRKLAQMYDEFFAGLASLSFRAQGDTNVVEKSASNHQTIKPSNQLTIVMSFPFWNIHGTYSYFTEIYDIIEKHGFSVESLLPWEMKLNTMKGSLLYRRENQTVGREIIKIVKK